MFKSSSTFGNNFEYLAIFQQGYNKGYRDAIAIIQGHQGHHNSPYNIPSSGNHQARPQRYQTSFSQIQQRNKSPSPLSAADEKAIKSNLRATKKPQTSSQAQKQLQKFYQNFERGFSAVPSSVKNQHESNKGSKPSSVREFDNMSMLSQSVSSRPSTNILKETLAEKIKLKMKKRNSQVESLISTPENVDGTTPLTQNHAEAIKLQRSSQVPDFIAQGPEDQTSEELEAFEKNHENQEQLNQDEEEELFSHIESRQDQDDSAEEFQKQLEKQQFITPEGCQLGRHQECYLDGSEDQICSQDIGKPFGNQAVSSISTVTQRRSGTKIRKILKRRSPFTSTQIQQIKADFQKIAFIQKQNPSINFSQQFHLIQAKYDAGKTTMKTLYSHWLKDPTLKIYERRKYCTVQRKQNQSAKHNLRKKAIQDVLRTNPFMTNVQIAQTVEALLKSQNPQKKLQIGVSNRIIRDLTKRLGYTKRRYRFIASSRNSKDNIELRRKFCERLTYHLRSQAHVLFMNVDDISLNPYLSKEFVWAKSNQNQYQILSREFRENFLNGVFVVGKKYLNWEIIQGIWSNDKYVELLNMIVGKIYSDIQTRNYQNKKIVILVNPKYKQDQKTLKWSIQKQSELKLSVLQKLCCSVPEYAYNIRIQRVPPFSTQLDMVSSLQLYLRQKQIHKLIPTKEWSYEDIRKKLWELVIGFLENLKELDYEKLDMMWQKFVDFVDDGLKKRQF